MVTLALLLANDKFTKQQSQNATQKFGDLYAYDFCFHAISPYTFTVVYARLGQKVTKSDFLDVKLLKVCEFLQKTTNFE